MCGTDDTNVRESIDAELRETELRFSEFDVAKEEFGNRGMVFVVGDE